jgi:hypothetical protein
MQLPHVDEAHIPAPKISEYLLAVGHPTGRSKALFFHSLGFRTDQPADLREALLQQATNNAVSSLQQTAFGSKYLIDGQIVGPKGAAVIRSVWFVEFGERRPRLITAYPLRGVQK